MTGEFVGKENMKKNPSQSTPIRVQLSRKKGSKLSSPNGLPIVVVARPSKWGSPFSVENNGRVQAVKYFRLWWEGKHYIGIKEPPREYLHELRGKNLACWCDPTDGLPCHADVLLELANL